MILFYQNLGNKWNLHIVPMSASQAVRFELFIMDASVSQGCPVALMRFFSGDQTRFGVHLGEQDCCFSNPAGDLCYILSSLPVQFCPFCHYDNV